MRQHIDFIFNELYPHQGLEGATYEKCISLFSKIESLTDRGYLFKLNNSLQCQKQRRNGDARAWGILTLCDLAEEIVKTREQITITSTEFNPLDVDLKISLNLPGENNEHDEVCWRVFSLGVASLDINAAGKAQALEKLENDIITISKNPDSCLLDKLNRISSLYIKTLAILSRI